MSAQFHATPIDPRKTTCWLTGLSSNFMSSSQIDSCHIVDEQLLPKGSPLRWSPNNKILLQTHIHRLWDDRHINFDPTTGTLITAIADSQLRLMGIPKNARLHRSVLTPERCELLSQRIQGWNEFRVAVGASKFEKAEEKREQQEKQNMWAAMTKTDKPRKPS